MTTRAEKPYRIRPSILIALLYGAFLTFAVHWHSVFEFDPDEGYNVIKALMLEQGYTLYNEVWSDQPPAFTYLLWLAFKLFGWNIDVGRMVVIAFASLMVFGIYDSVRRVYSTPAAFGTVIFLLASYRITVFSVAIMLGLPSLAMAVMSGWAMVVWYTRRRNGFLLASGMFLGASVSIKLFTLFLVPIVLLSIVLFGKQIAQRRDNQVLIRQLAIWSAGMAITGLVLLSPALWSLNPSQLITAHANNLLESRSNPGKALWKFIVHDWPLISMGVLGLLVAVKDRNPVGAFFGLWMLAALVILYIHHPVWYHHALLLLLPASVMAGLPAHWLYATLTKRGWNHTKSAALALVAIVLIAVIIPATHDKRLRRLVQPWHYSKDTLDQEVTEVIERYAGPEHTMITSRQMYAFRTRHAVPPFLSVTSIKRYRAGLWNAETILGYIDSDRIEQVVLNERWTPSTNATIAKALQGRYTKVYSDEGNRKVEIFVSNELLGAKRPSTMFCIKK